MVESILNMAQAEAAAPEPSLPVEKKVEEIYAGDHGLAPQDIKDITLAFEKKFDKPLPVSARGETAVHRALGFDHTGRIDVALAPDSTEGCLAAEISGVERDSLLCVSRGGAG